MLKLIRSVLARLSAHPVCEVCEAGMARDLDAILDALMVNPEVNTDADPWARIVQAREVAYRLRMDFNYLGAYVPARVPADFDAAMVIHDLDGTDSGACASDCSGCAFEREIGGAR